MNPTGFNGPKAIDRLTAPGNYFKRQTGLEETFVFKIPYD